MNVELCTEKAGQASGGSALRLAASFGLGLALALITSAAGSAQRLWSVGEVSRAPDGPAVVVDGAAVGPSSSGPSGMPLPAGAASIQVELDYLRLGIGHLKLPLMDGSVIETENAVFEDRGGGNLLWTGEVPGAGYESVVFTVRNGHLVGWFGEPGGPKYIVKAGPDGRGTLAKEEGPTGDWCGAGSVAHDAGLGRSGGAHGARASASTADSATRDVIEILVLYSERTARLWRPAGGIDVAVQHHSDYVNMVWRNGRLPVKAELIAAPYEPAIAQHPSTQGLHFRPGGWFNWFAEFQLERERLALEHGADMVYFLFSKQLPRSPSGFALTRTDMNPSVLSAWGVSTVPAVTAHEVGHLLGGNHEPFTFSDFPDVQARALRPHAFAHTDLSSCEERAGEPSGRRGCPISALSYGDECLANPETYGVTEPYYSSVRHQPNGWTIGVANERENERLFQETVPVAAISNSALNPEEDYGWPGGGSARWLGRDKARVMLQESIRNYFSYLQIVVGLDEGGDDTYFYSPEPKPWLPASPNMKPIFGGGDDEESIVGFELEGLRPGGRYRMAFSPHHAFVLEPPEADIRAPAAPNRIAASVTDPTSIRLSWADNSEDETGFEVWYRKWSWDAEPTDEVWRRYGPTLPARTRSVVISGMGTDEYVSTRARASDSRVGRYSFVVVAVNRHGFEASETFHYEFAPGPHPEPTTAGAVTDCIPRDTGPSSPW